MPEILIVDDDLSFASLTESALQDSNYRLTIAHSGEEALEMCKDHIFDVCLFDIMLPDMSGVELLHKVKEDHQDCRIFMVTGQDDIPTIISSIKGGAEEYFTKPVDFTNLKNKLERAVMEMQRFRELKQLREQNRTPFIGQSEAIQDIRGMIRRVGPQKTTILITGETGAGKEVVARQIHENSERSAKRFFPFNCSGVPETLIESEFFGHERGAFTGAERSRKGIFEEAEGGTVFLDEIGEMPLGTQTKLLRLLEERKVRRLGGDHIDIDVRIICATNRKLAAEVDRGTFREDLFYRINVLNIDIPPLRERRADIIPLVEFFLERMNTRPSVPRISDKGKKRLQEYPWPGNGREVRNIVERELLLNERSELDFSVLAHQEEPSSFEDKHFFRISLPGDDIVPFQTIEKAVIRNALERNDSNISRTARFLDIGRSTLRSKIKRLGIQL